MLAVALLLTATAAQARPLDGYRRPEVQQAVMRITREAIAAHLAHRPYTPAVPPALKAPAGVFVTFSRDGLNRACWGTVRPTCANAAYEIAANAVKALTHDYRQAPVSPRELAGLVAHVSIVGPLTPTHRPREPRRYGLLVAAPGKGGVLLPGEALTAEWQLAQCRKKAGLRPGDRASLYRFETTVVGPVTFGD